MNIKEALEKKTGEITIKGWVYRERGSNKLRFLIIRDTDNIIQCVIKESEVSEEIWQQAVDVKVEAAVTITGTLRADERAPTGVELQVSDFAIIGESNEFPITKDLSAEHVANYRHLWLRSRKINAAMKLRAACFKAFRNYFDEQGFYEFHSPIFQATQAEGGSELFRVKYFDDELYLSQTWQLYAEAGVSSIEKIYTIAPTFRAENSKTSRHLTEFWMAEMEQAFIQVEDLHEHAQNVIQACIGYCLKNCQEELTLLERDTKPLKDAISKDFVRISYDEAIQLLQEKCDMQIEWGKDLRTLEEEALTELYDVPIIVTDYPKIVKAFYMKETPNKPECVQGFDVLVQGVGEIVGGSQREEDINKIIKELKAEGEDPADYEYYLDTRRYGSIPHGGFGLGMERLIAWIGGLDGVKDAIAFPRTPTRYKP